MTFQLVPTFLVFATFFTGLVWAVDALLLAPRRRKISDAPVSSETIAQAAQLPKESLLVEYSRSFFPVLLLVLVIRSFLAEPFRIPSGSMMPTLLVGDFVLVNKFSYGLRLPVLNQKVVELGKPQRGDVVVFRYPPNPQVDYIKRVIGLPGDRVSYRNKTLTVNGQVVPTEKSGTFYGDGGNAGMTGAAIRRETLGAAEHDILLLQGAQSREVDFVVPEGEYFVMGDNRDNSKDSRYWGTVPDRNLVGKAFMIWMNWDSDASSYIAWSRIGTIIH